MPSLRLPAVAVLVLVTLLPLASTAGAQVALVHGTVEGVVDVVRSTACPALPELDAVCGAVPASPVTDLLGDELLGPVHGNLPYTDPVSASLGLFDMGDGCFLLADGRVDCVSSEFQEEDRWEDHTHPDARAVSAKAGHVCFLLASGNVECHYPAEPTTGYDGGDAAAIATGGGYYDGFVCILRDDTSVGCHAVSFTVPLPTAAPIGEHGSGAIAIDGSGETLCILRDTGDVDCHGTFAPTTVGYSGGDAVAVSTGSRHACVVTTGGNVECWGDPTPNEGLFEYDGGDAVAVTASEFTCVLRSDGTVLCEGEWGGGDGFDYDVGDAEAIFAGEATLCILRATGGLEAMPSMHCRRDDGSAFDYPVAQASSVPDLMALAPVPPVPDSFCTPNGASEVATKDKDRDGTGALYARGRSAEWTLGPGGPAVTGVRRDCWLAGDLDDDGQQHVPLPPAPGCAAAPAGADADALQAWAICNGFGRVNPGKSCTEEPPCLTPGRVWDKPKAMSQGFDHTCVLLESRAVDCYGGYHEHGYMKDRPQRDVAAIESGPGIVCFRLTDRNVECTFFEDRAVEGYAGGDAIDLAVAGTTEDAATVCVLRAAGTVRCHQVADPAEGPVDASVTTYAGPAKAIDAGGDQLCLLLTTGNVECHALGVSPALAGYTGGDAVEVATQGGHACVRTAARNVDCWGRDDDGEAADRAGGDAVALAVGPGVTCVLTKARDVDCWGKGADYDGGDALAVSADNDVCVLRPRVQDPKTNVFDCQAGEDYPFQAPAQPTVP